MKYDEKWFYDVCKNRGLVCDEYKCCQMTEYVAQLINWNKKINLISRKDEHNVWISHILHSVSLLFHLRFKDNAKIVDIGTGGGLPGIPLKIMRPDISLLCIDSISKKVKALISIVEKLDIKDINVTCGRAEKVGMESRFHGQFDFAVARAVAPMKDLIKWARNFLKHTLNHNSRPVGFDSFPINIDCPALFAFKGGEISKEISDIKKMKLKDINVINLKLDDLDKNLLADKKIVVVRI